jgi:hypothetical protein
MSLPFVEEKINDNTFIRVFDQNTDVGEFHWHRDREDRIIEPLVITDWKIQLENQLPCKIEGKITIPYGVWHRLIKGTGDLKIKLIKLQNF